MNAVIGRVREARLNLSFEFAADYARQCSHFEISLAEFKIGDGLTDRTDQQVNAGNREDQRDKGARPFLFGRRRYDEKCDRHGDQVPENREDPSADHGAARLAIGTALRPVGLPEPGFGGMLDLKALLALGRSSTEDDEGHQSKTDAAEDQTEKNQGPVGRISGVGLRRVDGLRNGEQSAKRKGQGKQAEYDLADSGGAVHPGYCLRDWAGE